MASRALRSLHLWRWIATGALGLAGASRIVYGVLCATAADRVYPGLTAVRHGCALPRPLAFANAHYTDALVRVATFSTVATWIGVAAFAAFVGWSWTAFAAGAALAPRGIRLASPFEIVAMWMVPLIHLFMPFWYVRDLLRACDPGDLPPVDFHTLPPRGYRRPGVETTDAWARPWLPFRAWWALWAVLLCSYPVAFFVSAPRFQDGAEVTDLRVQAARAALAVVASVATLLVVRATTLILEERARRVAALKQA